jgi:hypothetical protein
MIRTMQLVVQLAHEVLAARHASLRASWAFGPLGPRLWDEELTLPGDSTCLRVNETVLKRDLLCMKSVLESAPSWGNRTRVHSAGGFPEAVDSRWPL